MAADFNLEFKKPMSFFNDSTRIHQILWLFYDSFIKHINDIDKCWDTLKMVAAANLDLVELNQFS